MKRGFIVKRQKVSLFFLAVMMIFFPFANPASAQSNDVDCENCSSDLEKAIKELTEEGLDVTFGATDEENEVIQRTLTQDSEANEIIEEYTKSGFEVLDDKNTFIIKGLVEDGTEYEKVALNVSFQYKDSEVVRDFSWVNLETEEIEERVVIYVNGSDFGEIVYSTNIVESPEGAVSVQASFEFDGAKFTCSVAGIIACLALCGPLGVVSPPVGIGCGVACDLAFAAACG